MVRIDDKLPDGSLDDQGRRPGKHNDRAGDLSSFKFTVQHHADDDAQNRGNQHDKDCPDQCVPQDKRKLGGMQHLAEIFRADETLDLSRFAELLKGPVKNRQDGQQNHHCHQCEAWQKPDVRRQRFSPGFCTFFLFLHRTIP